MKKIFVLLFLLTLSLDAQSTNFMDRAKNATYGVLQAIKNLPFLLEIANGTLSKSRFGFYSEQDKIYNWRYTSRLLELASQSEHVELRKFLIAASNDTMAYWQGSPPMSFKQCPSCQAYSNFELESIRSSFSQGLASIAPCYVVYWTVGNWLKQISVLKNPYKEWIDSNSSPRYGAHVAKFESLLNEVALNSTDTEQEKMVETYVRSAEFERLFWDSAYKESTWEPN